MQWKLGQNYALKHTRGIHIHCTLTFNDNMAIYGMEFRFNLSSSNKSYNVLFPKPPHGFGLVLRSFMSLSIKRYFYLISLFFK